MAIKTYTEQLEDVQTAITAIETNAQSYSIGGMTMAKARLESLYKREQYLRTMVGRETTSGIKVRRAVPER